MVNDLNRTLAIDCAPTHMIILTEKSMILAKNIFHVRPPAEAADSLKIESTTVTALKVSSLDEEATRFRRASRSSSATALGWTGDFAGRPGSGDLR
ncbi:MAG: hypothetical protein ACM3X0_09830 [Bacteroidota bacterium]